MHNSPFPPNNRFLTASSLRLCAVLLMLCDHLWASVIPGNSWMNYVGRMAFPIFAFQIAEGYLHTSNFKRYAKRLLLFALLSEIPFNLLYISSPIFPFHQNVLFTLLFGLCAVRETDRIKTANTLQKRFRHTMFLLLILLLSVLFFPDYGIRGVLTVVAFYLLRDIPCAWILQIAAMALLNIAGFEGMQIPFTLFGISMEFPVQGFAVLALLPIWCYNGKKGISNKVVQYGFYAFYPLHMLLLHLIRSLI